MRELPWARAHGEETGQAAIILALVMMAMLMSVGLAVDSGQLFNCKRSAQEAADAGAFAGATVLYQGGSAAQATAAATADALVNGYGTNLPTAGTVVAVRTPPTSGVAAGDAYSVEVEITTGCQTTLVPQQAGISSVRARSVAQSTAVYKGYAIASLDQTCTSGDVALSSNGDLVIHGGGIQINSCSSSAGTNAGSITMDAGFYTSVVGNVTGSWPNLRTGQPVVADPFAGIAKPSTSGLSTYAAVCAPAVNQPGIYTSGFTTNCNYILAPGTYILKGVGASLAGNSSMCTGPTCSTPTAAGGVFIFITSSTYPSTGGTCATFALNGNNATVLAAPTSGTYAGMLLWQDSVCTGTLSVGGNGSITTTGSIYVPNATVSGNGNNSQITASQIVAKKLDTQNADLTITYSSAVTYQSRVPAIVE